MRFSVLLTILLAGMVFADAARPNEVQQSHRDRHASLAMTRPQAQQCGDAAHSKPDCSALCTPHPEMKPPSERQSRGKDSSPTAIRTQVEERIPLPQSSERNGKPDGGASNPQLDHGGPDGFGYSYLSTQDPGDSVHYQWIDATGGTAITDWYPNPDDGYAVLTLPFPFPFYDETLSTINVCSNGFLETSTTTLYENATLPTSDVTNLIAPFWDDLSLTNGGTVYQYTPPDSSYFVIAFVEIARYELPHDPQTFEIVLSPDGRIRFNYRDVNGDRTSNTIGIQGDEGANEWYLQYVAGGNPSPHVVRDSTSILFAAERRDHDVGVSCVRSPSPVIAPGTTHPVIAKVRNFGRQPESFEARGVIVNTSFPFDTIFSAAPVPVSNLAPNETLLVNLGNVTPAYQGAWQVKLFTLLANDEQRNNDTARSQVSNSLPFGTPLGSWNLDALPIGFALGGITFSSDSNRFYLAVRDPNQIYSFAPDDPLGTLRIEPFQLLNLFGNDAIWGIAFDSYRHSFWIGHVEGGGNGTIVARYLADGAFAGDTWNLWSFEPSAWFAGMDYDPEGDRFYITKVSGTNAIYQLNFATKQVYRWIPGGQESYRACSYLSAATPWVLSGGWNQGQILRLDTLGNVRSCANLDSFADCDVFRPRNPGPDSLIYLMATLSNQGNTVKKISLGLTWRQLGIAEPETRRALPDARRPGILLACPSPQSNPVRILLHLSSPAVLLVTMFDLAGREVAAFECRAGRAGPQRLLVPSRIAPGVYFVVVQSDEQEPQQKIVVVR